MRPEFQQRIAALDAELVQLAKPILVLRHLNWLDSIEESFLENWRAGRPALPAVTLRIPDGTTEIVALEAFSGRCDGDDPILQFLRRTAASYAEAACMLMAAGTPEFAERLRQAVDGYFVDDQVEVVVDSELSSKAIAGTTRIRVRGSAMFTELDFDQLYHHEVLVHLATAINGRRQTNLTSLGLGAARTTRTQEGLAVFAELVTRSIDIDRLRRLALRIEALKLALDGADFLDCFKFFLEARAG